MHRWIHLEKAPVRSCTPEQADELTAVFEAIRREVGLESAVPEIGPMPLHNAVVLGRLTELAALSERLHQAPAADAGIHDPSELLRYMYTHCSEKLTLKGLSQLFYYSESSISSYLMRMTGLSFFDLLNEIRVGKAANLLLYTDLTIGELAEILGYVDTSHISKVFADRTGVKIGEYRKTYQKVGDICRIDQGQKACEIIAYIYRNYSQDLTARKTAEQFGIGVPQLHKLLLCQVERNFDDFLHFIRVNRASELLLRTDKSITDIASEVGYNSTKTLTRHFLKLRLMQPSVFRKQVVLQGSKPELE